MRKQRKLTQEALGGLIGLAKLQVYRYEKGISQPTLDILKKIAVNLHVSIDDLVFNDNERDPVDDFRLRFEVIQTMNKEDQQTIKSILDGMILKHQTRQTMGSFNP